MTAAPNLRRVLVDAGILAPESDRPQPTIDLSGLPVATAGDPRAKRYAEAALRSECFIMARTPEGARNDTLNRCAYKLGSLVSSGHLDRERMVNELWQAARQSGLDDREIGRTLRSGGRAGAETPRVVQLNTGPEWITTPERPAFGESVVDSARHLAAVADDPPSTGEATGILPALDWHETFANASLDPEWLVPDLFEAGGCYALYSPAKAGKSLLTLDMVAALATGRSVLGHPPAAPVPVLYVDHENSHRDIVQRLTAMGYAPSDLDGRLFYLSFPRMHPLDTTAGGAQLFAAVQHYGARAVTLDTVGRMIAGPENDADTWHALYRCTLAILKGAGITSVRLDHLGKDEERGMRGSSAKVSDVDAAYRLSRVDDSGVIRLERTHTRNGNGPDEIVFRQDADPLRHVPTGQTAGDVEVAKVIRLLDMEGVPAEWGRDRVSRFLRSLDPPVKVRNDKISRVCAVRQAAFRLSTRDE